jgi:hypothetical protein
VRTLVAVLVAGPLANGCHTVQRQSDQFFTEAYLRERWLPVIREGLTTRAQILQALGQPSRKYEDGRILAYVLMLDDLDRELTNLEYYLRVHVSPTYSAYRFYQWQESVSQHGRLVVVTEEFKRQREKQMRAAAAEYDLVLVFGQGDVLVRHALIRKPP